MADSTQQGQGTGTPVTLVVPAAPPPVTTPVVHRPGTTPGAHVPFTGFDLVPALLLAALLLALGTALVVTGRRPLSGKA